ncbi:MAG TPA: MarR family transcriptional regulator [Casimicrobiaceae bacterium]
MRASVDLESRARSDDHLSLRLWLRLLACTNLVEGRARAALRTEFATSLARFDLLAQLERVDGGLKMVDLGRRLMVTGGNVTRLVEQLESEGLVGRRRVPEDGRAYAIHLTAGGRRAFQAMAIRHETWIVAMFSALSQKERRQLYELLAKLKGGLVAVEVSSA